jgi:NADH:ubiquinone oxidoreductase subunit 2 (subunit N)
MEANLNGLCRLHKVPMTLFFCIEINVLIFSVGLLFVSLLLNAFSVKQSYPISLTLLLVLNIFLAGLFFPKSYSLFSNFILYSQPSALLTKFLCLILFVIFYVFLLISKYSFDEFEAERSFLYTIVLTSGLFLAGARDALTIFIFLEMISLASFGIIALAKTRYSYEAATKYLIFSSIASCFFITAFVFMGVSFYRLDLGVISHYTLFFPGHMSILQTVLPDILLAGSFFMKFGLGPFSGWLVDAYEASKYRDFVFLSTVGKLPLVVAFCQVYGVISNDFVKYFFVIFLFFFAIFASALMVKQKKIRRFFAYSSLFNFALAFILFFASSSFHLIVLKYFFFYAVLAMLGYIAFDLYRANGSDDSEPTFIDDLGAYGRCAASTCFAITVILNSGLPPLGIFLMKASAFGFFMVGSSFTNAGFAFLVSFFFLVLSMVNMFAYFRLFARVLSFESARSPKPLATNPYSLFVQIEFFFVLLWVFVPINYYWLYILA